MLVRAVVGTLAGCVGCQAGVEILQRKVKNSLNLLTLATCVFVSLEGILFRSMLSVKQEIPLRVYLKIVSIFFIVNLCNNTSIRCDIYFPLFIIFKSGSLLANIILCTLLRNRIYTTTKIFSVIIVTAGIIMFTLASYESKPSISTSDLYFFGIPPFCVGLVLLTTALMLSAYLGICQEDMYRTYGKHAKQSMFMVHTLSIPVYVVLGSELYDAVSAANATEPLELLDFNLFVPAAWVYIFAICVLQYICIDNVYRLTALTTSLNVTMVTSIRKFISVLISFMAIGNPYNAFHFIGAFLVCIGSIMFAKVK